MSTREAELVKPLEFVVAQPRLERLGAGRITAGPGALRRHYASRRGGRDAIYPLAKRVFDLLGASLLLLLISPLLVLIVAALYLDSHGPILYRQQRIGQHGRRFTLLKFRTMRPDRRARQSDIRFGERRRSLKTARDPRVTRVGRFLRRASLDELPQLLNVLRGDMSLVGPRPELPDMLRYYRPEHYRRHLALPGLTGWWQINGRCRRGEEVEPEVDIRQKLADDLHYIERRSIWFDLRIILQTIPVVLTSRGAI